MLRWRLVLGSLIIAALIGLCWIDHVATIPGVVLFPILVLFVLGGTREFLDLAALVGMRPIRGIAFGNNVLVIASAWAVPVYWHFASSPESPGHLGVSMAAASQWVLLALAATVLIALAAEMWRFEKPGGPAVNIAGALFAVVYVGFLMSFVVQLRMLWGIAGVASLLIVVKMGDTGAYAVGRLIGRHKMVPRLSPGKTMEGALGAVVFSCAGSWATFYWLVPMLTSKSPAEGLWWRATLFGLLLCGAGMVGDLAESLLKRDAGQKDSSSWLPGFGGVLDLLDSILLAAPVAYACWAIGLVG
jgi:phosphatidate cytidylyltransferase